MRWIGLVVIAVAACVSVDATRIRRGLYVVSVRGNAFGGSGQAIAAAHERADELCPNGYEIQDSASDSTSAYLRTSYGVQQIRRPEITLVVRCERPETPWCAESDRSPRCERPEPPQSTAPQPAPGTSQVAMARWWCVTFSEGRLGTCYRSPAECERRRSVALQTDPDAPPCATQRVASCFGVAFPGQEGSDDICHPTPEACANQRAYVLERPDQARVLTGCRAID